jgi:hypothetical protein
LKVKNRRLYYICLVAQEFEKRFRYYLSGYTFETNVYFPELIASTNKPNGSIFIKGNVSPLIPKKAILEKKYADSNLNYIFRKNIGHIAIWNKHDFEITPTTEFSDEYIRMLILGSIAMLFISSFGNLSLHAACIIINNKAVLIAGDSGKGKSSLAAYFHLKNYIVFSDDVTNIQLIENIPFALPSVPRIKLSKEGLYLIGKSSNGLLPIPAIVQKFSLPLGEINQETKYQISHIIFPDFTDTDFNLVPIIGSKKLNLLNNNIYRKHIALRSKLFNHIPTVLFATASKVDMNYFHRKKDKTKLFNSFEYIEQKLLALTE